MLQITRVGLFLQKTGLSLLFVGTVLCVGCANETGPCNCSESDGGCAACTLDGGDSAGDATGDAASGDADVSLDRDDDGLADAEEDLNGNGVVDIGETDPDDPDTDNDGEDDYAEFLAGDGDEDGLSDAVESDSFDRDLDGVVDELDGDDADGPCGGERLLQPGTYTSDLDLIEACSPYVVGGQVVFAGATLSVAPGVTVRFRHGASLYLGDPSQRGTLEALGTESKPIVVESDESSTEPGDWGGIIAVNAESVQLSHLTIRHAGLGAQDGLGGALIVHRANDVALESCSLLENLGYGLYVDPDEGETPVETLFSAFADNDFSTSSIPLGISVQRMGELGLTGSSFGVPGRIELLGRSVQKSLTLSDHGATYFLNGDLEVTSPDDLLPTTLVLNAGVRLRMPAGARLIVGDEQHSASLSIAGTPAAPVLLAPRPDANGPWGGLDLQAGSHSIADAWFLHVGSEHPDLAAGTAILQRQNAFLSFGGTHTVIDSVDRALWVQSSNCSFISPLPGMVDVIGYDTCQSTCEELPAGSLTCIQP